VPDILTVGFGFTVTVWVAVTKQPFWFVAVTVNDEVDNGFTDIDCVVAPVLQIYVNVVPPTGFAVKVVAAPLQMVDVPDTVIVGFGLTVMVVGAEAEAQPAAEVPVTVKVPVADTVMAAVVEPLLHK
jgi:hypothetical protein